MLDVPVVAFSADNIEDARKMEKEFKVSFRLGYDLNVRDFVNKTGGYFHADKGFAQPAGFIVRADGTVATALYSSGAVGRYVASDILGQLEYLLDRELRGIEISEKTGQVAP